MATTNAKVVEANITVAPLNATTANGGDQSVTLTDYPGVYPDYEIRNRYEGDEHVYMMGITAPAGFQNQAAAFVQLAIPTVLWIADWTASLLGGKPFIPGAGSNNPNWILLDKHYEPGMIDTMPDGQTLYYRISGTFVYGCVNPGPDIINILAFARPPWINPGVSQTVDSSMIQQGLINIVSQNSQNVGFIQVGG